MENTSNGIRDELINAALGAIHEKTGGLLQSTTNREMQQEMIDESATLATEVLNLPQTPSRLSPSLQDSPKS